MRKPLRPLPEEEVLDRTPLTGTLQQRKQQFVRDAIWNAAIELFDRKGFEETTVDEITEAAGTSRRSFFRYFQSKSDLMAHGIVSYGSALSDAIEKCPADDSPAEVFRSTVLLVARMAASKPQARKVMKIAARYPDARDAQIARLAEVQESVAEAFARRFKKRNRSELDSQVLAALTMSMLSVVFRHWFQHGQEDVGAAAEQVFATLSDVACGAAQKKQSKARLSRRPVS